MTTSGQLAVPERNRTRLVLLGCALAVILAGLLIRFGVPWFSASPLAGLLGDLGGSVLYAALWVILIRFVRPTMQRMPVALWAFGISAAVELLQLTAFPSLAVQKFAPLALLLGSTFNPLDLVGYALGAVLGVLLFGTIGAQKNRT